MESMINSHLASTCHVDAARYWAPMFIPSKWTPEAGVYLVVVKDQPQSITNRFNEFITQLGPGISWENTILYNNIVLYTGDSATLRFM